MTAAGPTGWRCRVRSARAAAAVVWSTSPLLVAGLAVTSVAAGLILPASAWLQREVVDTLVGAHGPGQHVPVQHGLDSKLLLALVVALGVTGIAAAAVPQAQQYVQANLRRAVRVVVYDRVYQAEASWPGISRFESPEFADKLQLTGQLAQTTASDLTASLLGMTQAVVTTVTFLISLCLLSPVLAAAIVGAACLAIWASLVNADKQAELTFQNVIRSRRQQSYSSLLSNAAAAAEVRLFGLGAFLRGRILVEMNAISTSERKLDRRLLRVESCLGALSSAAVGGGLVWVVTRISASAFPVGDVSLFIMSALGLQGAMSQIAAGLGDISQAVTTFTAYTDVVDAPPDLPVPAQPRPVPPLRDKITVENVWFRYHPALPWVLRGVSLTLPAGTHLALVGRNGSGKSTLVKLLCRLYDPQRGCIRWDGTDIREFDPAMLRERMAGVFQDHMCYELTAAENIGVGDLAALDDRDAIRHAAELAGAAADIDRLPLGYDTMLSRIYMSGPRGQNAQTGVALSGGQRQRVAMARALIRANRDLLIVDEPMASLDAEAEHTTNQRLAQVRAGRTCVLISHRLPTIRAADNIVVLADGAVAEQGTHDELIAADGGYAYLFRLQAAGYRGALADDQVSAR